MIRERRKARRWQAQDCMWLSAARLRPGPDVLVCDVSAGGARVDAPVRLVPGGRVDLVLSGPGWQWSVAASVVHVRVCALATEGPRYLAGLRFSRRLEIELLREARPKAAWPG